MSARSRFIVLLACALPTLGKAQVTLSWNVLANVSFEERFEPTMGLAFDYATFGEQVKAYEGRKVKISGYLVPVDALGITHILSKYPNSTCFFCGGAGPETVVDLHLHPSAFQRFKTDEKRTFTGVLRLNADGQKGFHYVLEEAMPQ